MTGESTCFIKYIMACRKPGVRLPLPLPDGKHHLPGIGEVTVKSGGAVLFGYRADNLRDSLLYDYVDIPCGDCEGCRLRASREKTYRLVAERELHQDAWFVTLTYRNEDLTPAKRVTIDPQSGELHVIDQLCDTKGNVLPCATIRYDEFQAFEKRLRRRIDYMFGKELAAFRQYHCGEYGGKTLRPHFHCILYGIPESVLLCKQKRPIRVPGKPGIYQSLLLDECWGHGVVGYAKANFEAMQYVAGYTLKKRSCWQSRNDAEVYYASQGIDAADYPRHMYRGKLVVSYPSELVTPEKGSGSNRPGLGRGFYEAHRDEMYRDYTDEMLIHGPHGALRVRPSSYFDRLYDLDAPSQMAELRRRRRAKADEVMSVRIHEYYPDAPAPTSDAWARFKVKAERLLRASDQERDADVFRRVLRKWKEI